MTQERAQLSRRGFLAGAAGLAAVTALPVSAWATMPRIVGDGVHDDTAAIQAALDRDGGFSGEVGKTYRITKTLNIPNDGWVMGAAIKADTGDGAPAFFCGGGRPQLRGVSINTPAPVLRALPFS